MDVEDIYNGVFTNEKERKLSTEKTVAWEIFLLDHLLSLVVALFVT